MIITVVLPFIAHAVVLLGFLVADPMYRFGALGTASPGLIPGFPTIDPNAGTVDQALTKHAADLLLSGTIPWWNSLEGFGSPLAGEMQCSALFPFSLLLELPNGALFENIVMSVLAGVGMLCLSKRLGLQVWPALISGITFEMCGTFSWLSGAWSYSIPWLPFLILGIELSRSQTTRDARAGVIVIAVSVALLLYAGFIETSYLEGLVGVAWFIARLMFDTRRDRVRFSLRVIAGGLIGLALGGPIIVAFADDLAISVVGMHDASDAGRALVPWALFQKIVPYIYGPIFASGRDAISVAWGNMGGYTGFVLPVLAVAALFGRLDRSVRFVCATTVVLGIAAIFGGPLQKIVLMIPGVKYTAYYRYIDPSIAFALSYLGAMTLNDLLSSGSGRWRIALALVAVFAFTVVQFQVASPQIFGAEAFAVDHNLYSWHTFSLIVLLLAIAAIIASLVVRTANASVVLLGATAALESLVFLFVPTLSYPQKATIATGGIAYLQAHLGNQRFYSLGPIEPNYGSFFNIAELDYDDLPAPVKPSVYVQNRLHSASDGQSFMGRPEVSQRYNFANNLEAFGRVAVKYVIVPPGDPSPSRRLVPRFRDKLMSIYELPHVTSYFTADGCAVHSDSRNAVITDCAAPSTLCRLELNAPGWQAKVNDTPEPVGNCSDIFQSVSVPAGKATMFFRFVPPYVSLAEGVAILALLALSGLIVAVYKAGLIAVRSTSSEMR